MIAIGGTGEVTYQILAGEYKDYYLVFGNLAFGKIKGICVELLDI